MAKASGLRLGMAKSPLERIARALCDIDRSPADMIINGQPVWMGYLPKAKAALEAIREPSEAMDSAAAVCESSVVGDVYRAMIDAALEEGAEQPVPAERAFSPGRFQTKVTR